MLEGRTRRCASQEANAVFASIRLNLADEQTENLLIKLLSWQWPDGAGTATSARKPRIPLSGRPGRPCALLTWKAYTGSSPALKEAIAQAVQFFLQKRLFLRESSGEPMQPGFTRLHQPPYWK